MAPLPLQQFLDQHRSIKSYTSEDPAFPSISATFIVVPHSPSIVLRPQSAEDVAALIAHCASTSTAFVIRSGGHDCSGRSVVADALQIDLRDIAYVRVSADKTTARVGGGVSAGRLLEELQGEGLVTPTGTVGSIGYVGWATLGGYGPLSSRFGLGVDQIVGAKIVTAAGDIVDAGEKMLEGLRGGGGCFCVVVELTIRIYPVEEIQGGAIIFDSTDLASTITTYFTNYNRLLESTTLPPHLDLQPAVLSFPQLGNALAILYTWWGSASADSQAWHARITALGPAVLMSTVRPTTLLQCVRDTTAAIPRQCYPGRAHTANLRGVGVSSSAAATMAVFAARQPADGGAMLSLHSIHGALADGAASLPGVFGARGEHHMVEVVGMTVAPDAEEQEAARAWADGLFEEMRGAEGVMRGSYYPSLAPTEVMDWRVVYGEKGWETLRQLKRELDPRNVFKNTIPRFAS